MENGTLSITLPRHFFGPLNVSLNKDTDVTLLIDGAVSIKAKGLLRNSADHFNVSYFAPTHEAEFLLFDVKQTNNQQEKQDNFPFARTCAKIPNGQ